MRVNDTVNDNGAKAPHWPHTQEIPFRILKLQQLSSCYRWWQYRHDTHHRRDELRF